jgi:hypothetical protein
MLQLFIVVDKVDNEYIEGGGLYFPGQSLTKLVIVVVGVYLLFSYVY